MEGNVNLRLLPEPVEVALEWVRGVASAEGVAERTGSEAVLRCLGREWRVVEWTGPERIQTAWWTDSACHRDYYQAVALQGALRAWLAALKLTGDAAQAWRAYARALEIDPTHEEAAREASALAQFAAAPDRRQPRSPRKWPAWRSV